MNPTRRCSSARAHQLHARYTFRAPIRPDSRSTPLDARSLGVPSPAPAAFAAAPGPERNPSAHFELVGGTLTAAPIGSFLLRAEMQWSFRRPIALRRRDLRHRCSTGARTAGPARRTAVRRDIRRLERDLVRPRGAAKLLPSSRATGECSNTFWPVESTRSRYAPTALLSDRLRLGVVGLLIGLHPLNTWAARAQVGYAFTDSFHMQLQFIHYQPTEHFGIFYGFTTHDRWCSPRSGTCSRARPNGRRRRRRHHRRRKSRRRRNRTSCRAASRPTRSRCSSYCRPTC